MSLASNLVSLPKKKNLVSYQRNSRAQTVTYIPIFSMLRMQFPFTKKRCQLAKIVTHFLHLEQVPRRPLRKKKYVSVKVSCEHMLTHLI